MQCSCNVSYLVGFATDVGVMAAAGAILAAATDKPVGLTALAFAVTSVAIQIFMLIVAKLSSRCNNKPLQFVINIGALAIATVIAILALKALAIITTPGIILLSVLGGAGCLISTIKFVYTWQSAPATSGNLNTENYCGIY